jgi:tetratricopeptide (TPR) repeat protein
VVNNLESGGGSLGPGPGHDELYAQGIPDLVREAVTHRVLELGPNTERVLEIASTIGREFESELVVKASELSADEVLSALESAVSAGLLADVPGTLDRYTFAHALFRQTVYAEIPKQRRAALHGRLADALEQRHGSDPRHVAELARHYSNAGPSGAPKALEYCVRAGAGALGALAFDEAVDHYGRALNALDTTGSTDERLRCEILLAIGEAERRGGDLASSRETFGRAARLAQTHGDAEALGRAALGFCGLGWEWYAPHDREAVNLLRSALAKGGQPEDMRARLLARLAVILRFSDKADEAQALSNEALEIAHACGSDEALAAALIARWHALSGPDGIEERAELSRQLAPLAAAFRNRDLELHTLMLQAVVSLETASFVELEMTIAEHARLADRMKDPAAQIHSHAFQAMSALMEGRFEAAEETIGEILELGTLTRSSSAIESSSIELFALYFEQGRLAELEEPVRSLAAGSEATAAWRVALAFLLAELERPEEAQALLDELAADDFAEIPDDATRLGALGFLALTADRLGDLHKMESIAGLLAPYRGRPVVIGGAAAYAGTTSHYLGVVAAGLGRYDEAIEYLEEAVSDEQSAGALPWLARSRYELTRALAARGSNGDDEQAGHHLGEASRTAEELQMVVLLEQMRGGGRSHRGVARQSLG